MSSPEARAAEVIDYVGDEPSNVIAAALAKEGLLTPEPQVIRTREELAALDPDTVLGVWHPDLDWGCIFMTAREWAFEQSVMPLSVIATGEQARAARQALEDTDATD